MDKVHCIYFHIILEDNEHSYSYYNKHTLVQKSADVATVWEMKWHEWYFRSWFRTLWLYWAGDNLSWWILVWIVTQVYNWLQDLLICSPACAMAAPDNSFSNIQQTKWMNKIIKNTIVGVLQMVQKFHNGSSYLLFILTQDSVCLIKPQSGKWFTWRKNQLYETMYILLPSSTSQLQPMT